MSIALSYVIISVLSSSSKLSIWIFPVQVTIYNKKNSNFSDWLQTHNLFYFPLHINTQIKFLPSQTHHKSHIDWLHFRKMNINPFFIKYVALQSNYFVMCLHCETKFEVFFRFDSLIWSIWELKWKHIFMRANYFMIPTLISFTGRTLDSHIRCMHVQMTDEIQRKRSMNISHTCFSVRVVSGKYSIYHKWNGYFYFKPFGFNPYFDIK